MMVFGRQTFPALVNTLWVKSVHNGSAI